MSRVDDAITLLRQRADAVPRGPWKRGDRYGIWTNDEASLIVAGGATNGPATSEFIASMHPRFALEIAATLDAMQSSGDPAMTTAADSLAAAYLGAA